MGRAPLGGYCATRRGALGHDPGQNFIYVHLKRIIKKQDLDMFYVTGPGHGGPAFVGNTYLEGTYSEVYPNVTQDEEGMKKLFTQFSFPGGLGLLLVLSVGYGWGYRGWGAPFPRYVQRRRTQQATSAGAGGGFDHQA